MHNLLFIFLLTIFSSPVDFPITLAGNFGEPRPNHFHGGIDIKTERVEGKIVRSIGDGYISRITIGKYGYGNAIFVNHPSGYTSVYCHLKRFHPIIEALATKKQYEQQSYAVDATFEPSELPVESGQIIALSGNTGASVAPHLHLELRRQMTDEMVDPIDFIDANIVDNTPPMAHGFMAQPIVGEGMFMKKSGKQVFSFTSHNLKQSFQAWGKVGFAIWANDYMEGSFGNKYGIRSTQLFVDDSLVFNSNVTNIPLSQTRMVNSWGDYPHYLRSNVWYMKSFIENGNHLTMLQAGADRGIVDFNEERTYKIRYVISDAFANSSEYTFYVKGERCDIAAPSECNSLMTLYANRPSFFDFKDVSLTVREGLVGENFTLQPTISSAKSGLSQSVSFTKSSSPLFGPALLSMRLLRQVSDISKLYIVSHLGIDRYLPAFYSNGCVCSYINELGATYEIAYDDVAPVVTPTTIQQWGSSGIIRLSATDSQSGLSKCEATVDGQFVLLKLIPKSNMLQCKLKDTPIKRTGKPRKVEIVATDNVGNTNHLSYNIIY